MPIKLRDLGDTNFGSLNQSKNKNVIRYNHSIGKFDIISADEVLSKADNPPESFIDVVESEIDINNVTFTGIDGGVF